MKNILNIISVYALSLISIPALSFTGDKPLTKSEKSPDKPVVTEYSVKNTGTDELSSEGFFTVLDTKTNELMEVPVRDYIIGAVCAEMPASFSEEALKAQAVASHTYALYQSMTSKDDKSLMGADFSNDPAKYQAYFTDEEIRRYYGDKYDEYYGRICAAVDEVADMILVYNDEPIVAAFHSMSSGMTESAETIWGQKIDYLVPCISSSDTEAPGFSESYTFTDDELRSRLLVRYPDLAFSGKHDEWFSIGSRSESGTVLELTAGNTVISGTEFRELLSLRSANFEISYAGENKFCITTKGYGHGVGMSQYGANAMAEAGSGYEEILKHYYSSATLKTIPTP